MIGLVTTQRIESIVGLAPGADELQPYLRMSAPDHAEIFRRLPGHINDSPGAGIHAVINSYSG